jgi:hypothetical protein
MGVDAPVPTCNRWQSILDEGIKEQ